MEAGPVLRVARTAAFGAVASVLALGGHVLGGGTPPSALATFLVVLPVAAIGAQLSRQAPSAPRSGAVLAAVQVAAHGLLTAAASPPAAVCVGHGGHAGHGAALASSAGGCLATPAAPAAHPHLAGQHGGVAMLAGHALAAVITAVLLTHGERAVESAVAGFLRHVTASLPGAVRLPVPVRPALTPVAVEPAAVGRVVTRHVRRRGPPVTRPAVV